MEVGQIREALLAIRGVTFASLDAVTVVSPGILKYVTNEQVLLYNSRVSGYESLVQRRLLEEGLDPNSFSVGDLPWGFRDPSEPPSLIFHKGTVYLQTIQLREGTSEYTLCGRPVSAAAIGLRPLPPRTGQGLPPDKTVSVLTYKLESITALRLMGEEFKT